MEDNQRYKRKVLNINQLAKYQENSVVSTMLIAKNTGTVTMFAFGKGEGLSEHTAPFDAMVMITDGEAEITISKEQFTVKAGETIIMPANEPHALKAVTDFKMVLIMIKG